MEIFDIATGETRVVWQTERLVEAPNWSPDGKFLIINGDGRLYRLGFDGSDPTEIDTGFARHCNNDHGISPDGSTLVISDKTEFGSSAIYLLPAEGGTPRLVTRNLPSYWHGWSPDGRMLAYCGIRDQVFDIYTIPVDGGEERRLTQGRAAMTGRTGLRTGSGSISIRAVPAACRSGGLGRTARMSSASPTVLMATGFRILLRTADTCSCSL